MSDPMYGSVAWLREQMTEALHPLLGRELNETSLDSARKIIQMQLPVFLHLEDVRMDGSTVSVTLNNGRRREVIDTPIRRPMCRCTMAVDLVDPELKTERENTMKDDYLNNILVEAKIAVEKERKRPGSGVGISTSRYDKSTQGTMRVPAALLVKLIENPPAEEASIRAAVMSEVDDARESLSHTDKMHYVVPGDVMEDVLDAIEAACDEAAPEPAAETDPSKVDALKETVRRLEVQLADARAWNEGRLNGAASPDPIGDKLREIVGRMTDKEIHCLKGDRDSTRTGFERYEECAALVLSLREEKLRPFDGGLSDGVRRASEIVNRHNAAEYVAYLREHYDHNFATQELQQQPVRMAGDSCAYGFTVRGCPQNGQDCATCIYNPIQGA